MTTQGKSAHADHKIRQRTDEAVRESAEKYRTIFDSSTDMMCIQDIETGEVLDVNKVTLEKCGCTKSEFLKKGIIEFTPKDPRYTQEKIVEKVRQAAIGKEQIFEWAMIDKGGEIRDTEVRLKCIKIEGKDKLLAVVRDITDRKRAEESQRKSKDLLEKTLSSLDCAVFILDNESPPMILDCNPAAERIFGYEKCEMLSKTTAFLHVSKDTLLEFQKALYPAVDKEGFLSDFEFKMRRKDGQVFPSEHSILPLEKANGLRAGWVSVVRDITERKRAEEAYRSLVDHSLQGLAIFQDGRIVFANEAMAQITGYSVEDMLTMSPKAIRAFVHPGDREIVWTRHQQRLEGKLPPERYVLRGIRKDGSVRWLEIDANRIEFQGRPAIQAAYLDITESKNAEQREQQYIRDLQHLSESATEFVELTPDEDIYRFICEKLNKICDECIVAVNTYDKASESLCVRALAGLGKYTEAVTQIMGAHPVGRYFPIDNATKEGLGHGELLKIPNGIYDLSPGIPRRVCQAIEKLLGLGDVYAMGLNSDGRLYGSAAILTRGKTGLKNRDLIETFINQATVAIRRWEAAFALQQSEEKHRLLLQHAGCGIGYFDLSGRTLFFNDKALKNLDGTPEDYIGKPAIEVFGKVWGDRIIERIRRVSKIGQSTQYEDEVELPTGRKWFVSTYSPIHGSEGQCVGVQIVSHDITERKKAEEVLRESEEMFRSIFETSLVGVAICSTDKKWLYMNNQMCKILGYSDQELRQMTWEQLTHPEDLEADVSQYNRLLAGEIENYNLEKRFIRKDGSVVYARIYISCKRDQYGAVEYDIGLLEDITDRKQAEEALRFERDRTQQYLDIASVMLVAINTQGQVILANRKTCEVLGYEEQEVLGKNWFENFVPQRIREGLFPVSHMLLSGDVKGAEYYENPILTRAGEERLILWHNTVIRDEAGHIVGHLSSGEDITERKRAEDELREYQSKLKAMASQLSSVQEKQRRQLAVELHDRITQKLAMAKLGLETTGPSFKDTDAAKKVKDIAEQIGRTMEDAYSLMLELSNPVLYEISLKAAVKALLQSDLVKNSGMKCRLVAPGKPMKFDTDVRIALYQAIRELLANAVKHSQAKEIIIDLQRTDDAAMVAVQDDGVGFDPSDVKRSGKAGGFGLFNMRESIRGLGGEFIMKSKPGGGTSAIVLVPLSQNDSPIEKGGEHENIDRR